MLSFYSECVNSTNIIQFQNCVVIDIIFSCESIVMVHMITVQVYVVIKCNGNYILQALTSFYTISSITSRRTGPVSCNVTNTTILSTQYSRI